MDLADLLQNADAYAKHLAKRDYAREGVQMILALEDLRAEGVAPMPVTRANAQLARIVGEVAARLAARGENETRALHLALETVAFYDFGQDAASLSRYGALYGAFSETLRDNAPSHTTADSETTYLIEALRRGRFVRAVNFHNTFAEDLDRLGALFEALARRFRSIGLAELESLVAGQPWTDERPPLLLVFYEGTRNHIDVAAPRLEASGLRGLFCTIPGFTDQPADAQVRFAPAHEIAIDPLEYSDGRVALTWDEVRELAAQGHDIVCHTMTHADPGQKGTDIRLESVGAVRRLEEELNREVSAFVWQGGTDWGRVPRADSCLQEADIRTLISNLKVTRPPRT